jgi:putative sigma-54 modulation protein
MNITITGKNIRVNENQKDYAVKKFTKLETYFNQLVDSHVILSVEKLDHMAEILINGDGVQFHGKEKSGDIFSSIDLLLEKMEKQIRRYKEKHSAHKGPEKAGIPGFDMTLDGGKELVLRQASSKPADRIEAYLEMKLNKSDFILYKVGEMQVNSEVNYLNKNYAVLYKNGNSIKLIEIPFDMIRDHNFDCSKFHEFDVKIVEDSAVNPKLEFKSSGKCSIEKIEIEKALKHVQSSGDSIYPFFNAETGYLNVLYKNGKEFEIMVPAY